MQARELHIPTTWRVEGRVERVYEVLTKPERFVVWWPAVYLSVQEIKPGDANGVGRIVRLVTKGKLPYTLAWQAEVIEADKPRRMLIQASGDLDGRGEWNFKQDGDWTQIQYDWTVFVTKPWMIYLAPLLRPVFVANHNWAMQRGFEGLQRELAERA